MPHQKLLQESLNLVIFEYRPMPESIVPKPFNGNEHRSFIWKGSDCAALLVHGFPGTPAEMRPLGTVLRDAGWTVHGVMLPGLGADIQSLHTRTARDWSEAVKQAAEELKRHHARLVLVGYSMGGALALQAAQEQRPDGLVLLAPFWSFGEGWMTRLWPVARLLVRRVKPLKRADFSSSEVRRGLERMFDNIDLDDPQVQLALRQLTVSLGPIEQIRQLGQSAMAHACRIDVPTLVIQGSRDKVVLPIRTKHLVDGFANRVQYQEFDTGHDLIDPESRAWDEVKNSVLLFAASIRG